MGLSVPSTSMTIWQMEENQKLLVSPSGMPKPRMKRSMAKIHYLTAYT